MSAEINGVFYIERYTKNDTVIAGYFNSFEAAHYVLTRTREGNYDELETTGNICFQKFGLNQEPHVICRRYGDSEIYEDYYDENNKKVKTLRYTRRMKNTNATEAQSIFNFSKYTF